MAVAITAGSTFSDATGQLQYIYAKLTFSDNYATGGEVFDVSTLFSQYKAAPKVPVAIFITATNGRWFGYVPAATLAGGKIKITTPPAVAGVVPDELGAGAYPAGITGDTGIQVKIVCRKA